MLRGLQASDDARAIVVRLFRIWKMAHEDGEVGLGRMYQFSSELGLADEAATACASLFELIESEMERPLVRECCCSRTFSSDETALLGVIQVASVLEVSQGSVQIPHGLPGAIRWAAMAVRRALGWPSQDVRTVVIGQGSTTCPFASANSGTTHAL